MYRVETPRLSVLVLLGFIFFVVLTPLAALILSEVDEPSWISTAAVVIVLLIIIVITVLMYILVFRRRVDLKRYRFIDEYATPEDFDLRPEILKLTDLKHNKERCYLVEVSGWEPKKPKDPEKWKPGLSTKWEWTSETLLISVELLTQLLSTPNNSPNMELKTVWTRLNTSARTFHPVNTNRYGILQLRDSRYDTILVAAAIALYIRQNRVVSQGFLNNLEI